MANLALVRRPLIPVGRAVAVAELDNVLMESLEDAPKKPRGHALSGRRGSNPGHRAQRPHLSGAAAASAKARVAADTALDAACESVAAIAAAGTSTHGTLIMPASREGTARTVARSITMHVHGRFSTPPSDVGVALLAYHEVCLQRGVRMQRGEVGVCQAADADLLPTDQQAWLSTTQKRQNDPAADAANSLLGWYEPLQRDALARGKGVDTVYVASVGAYARNIALCAVRWSSNPRRRAHELLFLHVHPDMRATCAIDELWAAMLARVGRGESVRWDVAACVTHTLDSHGVYACLVRWGFVADTLDAANYMTCIETGQELAYTELIRKNLVFSHKRE